MTILLRRRVEPSAIIGDTQRDDGRRKDKIDLEMPGVCMTRGVQRGLRTDPDVG